MNKSSGIVSVILVLLVAGVLIMGCSSSDNSSPASTTTQTSVTTAAASSGALYSAGDIVKNPKSSSNTALLIVSYDAGSDTYERAFIYPNSDGSWGYRMDTKTDKIGRSLIDNVYTQKVGTKAVSAVPVKTPTPAATATLVSTTQTTVTSTTTAAASAPHVNSIDPSDGDTGTTVSITALKGIDFQSGATVSLTHADGSVINATNVVVSSSSLITCTIAIPSSATVGNWNVVVTNPDGQSHKYQTGFTVHQGTTSSTTTTTTTSTTTTTTSVTITQIQDTVLVTGGSADTKDVTVLGTNLSAAYGMQLVGGSTINSNGFICESSTRCKGIFNIPAGTVGPFYVAVADSSWSVLAKSSGTLTIQ